jgi:hypothetical protein
MEGLRDHVAVWGKFSYRHHPPPVLLSLGPWGLALPWEPPAADEQQLGIQKQSVENDREAYLYFFVFNSCEGSSLWKPFALFALHIVRKGGKLDGKSQY